VTDALIEISTSTIQLLAQAAPGVAPTVDPAAAPTPTGPKAAPGIFEFLMSFGPIIFILLLFWFLIVSTKRKEEAKRKALMEGLKKGDRVLTLSGMYGAIVEVRDDRVQVKIDESANVKVWFSRNAISGVVNEEK
jgi:preprotein translocase subunit YajC